MQVELNQHHIHPKLDITHEQTLERHKHKWVFSFNYTYTIYDLLKSQSHHN